MPPISKSEEVLLFVVEHFDPLPRLKRQYLLKVFIDVPLRIFDVEMTDVKTNKKFLKRSPAPGYMVREDLFIGATVLLYARELVIVDYGDGKTRSSLHHQMQQSMLIIPAEHENMQQAWGSIIDAALNAGLLLVRVKSVMIPADVADGVCDILNVHRRCGDILKSMMGCLVLCMQGEDGVNKFQKIAEQFDSKSASSLNSAESSILVSTTGVQAAELKTLLLEGDRHLSSTVTLDNCTCAIIKPHAVKSKLTGKIIDHILSQSYEISAVSSLYFDRTAAEEFLEVYKGVVPEYQDAIVELCSGMCVALELRAEDAVPTFRQTAGPWDVEMAKELRPDTLRGRYGVDRVRNAVHCTDLESDAVAENEYCFKIMEGYVGAGGV